MNVELRKIEKEDLEQLRQWRMQENVTKYMLTDPIISPEDQIQWFEKISNDGTRVDYVILVDNEVVGYYGITNIDKENKSCEVGFYIGDEKYRGVGVFSKAHKIIEDIVSHDLKLSQIVIIALKDNPACEAYVNMGFVIDQSYNNVCNKSGIPYKLVKLIKKVG